MSAPGGWTVLEVGDQLSREERAILRKKQDKLEKDHLENIKDLYDSFLHTRFNDPSEETKKEKAAALYSAFGDELNRRAVTELLDMSWDYMKNFRACASIEDGSFRYTANGYTHEDGDSPVVLQRENRRSISVPTKMRSEVLARDNSECLRCGASENLEVHHIVPVSRGGAHEIENLATLCSDCHNDARLSNSPEGEIPAYPRGQFEEWLNDELEICGAKTSKNSLCRNPRESCPHH